ncbi:MAG: sulfatase-like hydrolase/transferase [Akkermansiaceae bacterium]|nr:sulfatase-like hydrolase/transferase [Akkermansiaceae bacterium]
MKYLLIVLFVLAGIAAAAEKKPNILFIYSDDHSHRSVSCYPEAFDWVDTPNIDALAEKGVRFASAYIGTWCMPSRATILTGMHQWGVKSMRMEGTYPGSAYDPKQCPFWPSVFRAKGYQTAQIGKWHTGVDTGFGRDWDHQIVWNRPRHTDNSGQYYYDQLIEKNGGKAVMTEGYTTDNYTKWALDYLHGREGRVDDKPWYLWVCFGAVHGPFTPADRHLKSYPDAAIEPPADIYPGESRKGKPKYVRETESWVPGENGEPELNTGKATQRTVTNNVVHGNTLNDWVRQYHQGVLAIDEAVGKLVAALKETGQYENTLIVFTSDQGIAWGQHGFRVKLAPYDATILSPMIVSMPSRLPSGKVCSHPVSGVDLPPTFFSFAGIDLPWKMHGYDLSPLLKRPESAPWSKPVLTGLTGSSYGKDCNKIPTPSDHEAGGKKLYLGPDPGVPWWVSLRDGDLKYIRTLIEGEVEELYNLKEDPEELINLARNPAHRRKVLELREKTIAELKRTDAGMVDDLPKPATLP